VLAMLFCVAISAGEVGYVMLEARREGRREFWTAEGEELIAGAQRNAEKTRRRGGQPRRSAPGRTRAPAARIPDGHARRHHTNPTPEPGPVGGDDDPGRTGDDYRADS